MGILLSLIYGPETCAKNRWFLDGPPQILALAGKKVIPCQQKSSSQEILRV